MLETQITMEPAVARGHYLAYRALKAEQRTAEDEEIQRSYLELSRGHAIVNAVEALATAGLGADGRPRLAFCPASAQWCWLRQRDALRFAGDRGHLSSWDQRRKRGFLDAPLPEGAKWANEDVRTVVPPIPPAHRPAGSLDRYWLMWEVEEGGWEGVPPSDPALLRRLNRTTFAVLAVWDLTEIERMVLRGRDES